MNTSATKSLSSIYDLHIPANPEILSRVRSMVVDTKLRVDSISDIAALDLALVMGFFKVASSTHFSAGKPPVSNMKMAIERLGAESCIEVLDEISTYESPKDPSILAWLNTYRDRCRRIAEICRILAEFLATTLADDVQCSGIFVFVGDILAVMHFGLDYVKLAKDMPRSKVVYRLEKDHKFEMRKISINYLKKHGIPELVLSPLDPESQNKIASRGVLKVLVSAAEEFISGFDAEKWDKFAPGATIPPNSSIRLLKLTEQQYTNLYEKMGSYLAGEKVKAERLGLILIK